MSKIAIITGGATRLGACIAEDLAKKGWKTVIHYNTSHESAKKLQTKLNIFAKSILIQQDFSREINFNSFFSKILSELGTPTLLINNAATFFKDNIKDLDENTFNKNMNVNFIAPLFLTQKMCSIEVKNEKNVINIIDSSIDMYNTKAFLSYSLSKLSLLNATTIIAKQNNTLRVNAINPGFVLKREDETDKEFNEHIMKSSKKRITKIEDILKTIQNILNNPVLNGQNIEI